MVYSKRFYRFVFDRSTLTLSNKLSFNSMGIIGDATPGGWDTDTEMNFDTKKQRFWVDVTLSAGEFKFRADNDWAINFGGADGRLSQNGDNIKATAGNYRVYATLNNSAEITYELNAGDYGAGGGEEPDPGPEKADWYIHGPDRRNPRLGPDGHGERQLEHRGLQGRRNRGSRQLGIPLQERRRVAVDRGRRRIRRQQSLHLHDRLGLQGFRRQGQCRDRRSRHVRLLAAARGGTRLRDGRRRQAELVADTWGLVGNITGWGDLGDFSMSEEGAYLVRKGVALTTASEFKIRFNNAWDDSKNYGTASGGAVDINKAVDIITSGGSQNMKVQLDGTYDIYFDLANSQIYIMSEGKTPAEAE